MSQADSNAEDKSEPRTDSPAGPQPRTLDQGPVRWLASEAGAALLAEAEAGWIDRFRAEADPVKANPVRETYRLTLGSGVGPVECFLKCFHESSWSRRLKRLWRGPAARTEWRNLLRAERAGVPVPPPLAMGVRAGESYLLTASCRPAENLDEYLQQAGWQASVGEAVAGLLARLHGAGLFHHDLHAGNLLIRPGGGDRPRLWLIDLHKICRGSGVRRRCRDLGMLLAGLRQWGDREQLRQMVSAYERAAFGGRSGGGLVERVESSADRHMAGLLRSRDRSYLRDGKYFGRIECGGGWQGGAFLRRRRPYASSKASGLVFTRQAWRELLGDRDSRARLLGAQGDEGEQVFKDRPRVRVASRELGLGGHQVRAVVKHYRWRWRAAALADPFRPSRARRCFKRGHQLLARGVATALPLGYAEHRVGGLLIESVLVTEQVLDATWLNMFVMEDLGRLGPRARWRAGCSIARDLGEAMVRIRRAGFLHRDFKATNVLVQCDAEGSARLTLIDLDGLRRYRWWDRLEPLIRLNTSLWEAGQVTRTDRLRVLRAFLGAGGRWKGAWRSIARCSRRRAGRPGELLR